MSSIAYIAIDLHKNNSVIGHMDQNGKYLGHYWVSTSTSKLVSQVVNIDADYKLLTIEQGNMSFWAASILNPYVDKLTVCCPRYNRWVSGGMSKDDETDTYKLCELTRLGSLKPIYHDGQMGRRRLFLHQMHEYHRLNKLLVIQKRQLTSSLAHWGYQFEVTNAMYKDPQRICQCISEPRLGEEVAAKAGLIRYLQECKDAAFDRAGSTAGDFWEIKEFQKLPGIGPVGAHEFSAYIQTPHRFATASQLISFCKLAVIHHSSNGRRLRTERLSKAGHGCLKALAHRSWKEAIRSDNEVNAFYQKSLERCQGDEVKARLNTQRKILITLWSLWRHNQSYNPDKFRGQHGVSSR